MPNQATKKYSVLFKDQNGEFDMVHVNASNVHNASEVFFNDNKHSDKTIVVISEGTEFNNTYRNQNGSYEKL